MRYAAAAEEWAEDRHILHVPGNHELYGADIDRARKRLAEECDSFGITLLDPDAVVIDDVHFIGATLWTDFLLDGIAHEPHADRAALGISDVDGCPRPHRLRLQPRPADQSEEEFGSDARVRVTTSGTTLDGFPHTPFDIDVPAGSMPDQRLVRWLVWTFGSAAAASAVLGDGAHLSIAWASVLHRVRRADGTIDDYGDKRTVLSMAA